MNMNIVQDPVDALLKADAATADYINDDGFTLKVVDALPARARASAMARFAIPFGLTLLAAITVTVFAGGGNFLVDAMMDIATTTMTKSAFALIGIVGIMAAISLSALADN